MATTTASGALPRPHLPLRPRLALRPLRALAMAATLAALGLAITMRLPAPTPLSVIAVVGVLAATVWMLCSERYEWSLALLMLYVGLADGFLKLSTGSSQVTLVRDLLLYAIAAGALIRMAVRKERPAFPPLTGWVVAWLAVILVQLANPGDSTLLHSLASVRPHAEWVPLFFLGYVAMRGKRRLRTFLLLLLVVAAANGVVGLVQVNLSPEQLSAWGPGYKKAIDGEASVSQRAFVDESGTERNRPFALGSDIGFGGSVGFLAVPAALALLSLPGSPGRRFLLAALAAGTAAAVLTSEARVHVIASLIAILAFAGLTVTSRGGMRAVLGIAAGLAVAVTAVAIISSHSEEGTFSRYNSISGGPGQALSTAYSYRKDTLAQVPKYVVDLPLGAGIGSKGPAGSFGGSAGGDHLNGESEPTFLLIELGIPGLIVMTGFMFRLMYLSVTRIRPLEDRESRILLTAVAAPLFALFASWFAGVATATTPGAPYLWFAAGVLSYWLLGEGRRCSSA